MFQRAVIHDEIEFTTHNSLLDTLCYNRHQDTFVSVDDTCLRLWRARTGVQLRVVGLPARTAQFIQTILYIDARQLFVASALDNTLRLYDPNLDEVAALSTGRATVLTMVFDSQHHRLLTGGVDGCGAWQINPRPSGLPERALNAPYEFTPLPKFFHSTATTSYLRRNRSLGSHQRLLSSPLAMDQSDWVEHLQLGVATSRVYAQTRHWIDVFNTTDGAQLERWHELFPSTHGTITAFVVQERTKTLLCGTSSGAILVLSYSPIALVHVFDEHTQTITSLREHPSSHLVLSSSLDGSVRFWDLEVRRQAHRHHVGPSVHLVQFLPSAHVASSGSRPAEVELADRFYCQLRNTVKIYSIHSLLLEHQACLGPVCLLQRALAPLQEPRQMDGQRKAISTNEHESTNFEYPESDQGAKQLVLLMSMEKTLYIFAGRFQSEAPQFTWTPDHQASDLVALALNPVSQHLFLLLSSQKLVILPTSHPHFHTAGNTDGNGLSNMERVIDLTVSREQEDTQLGPESDKTWTSRTDSPTPSLRCLCVCPFSPVFNAVASDRRAPRQRRQSIFGPSTAPTSRAPLLQTCKTQSAWEWVACGSESGQLVFWHSGLCGGREAALTLDAHDAPIVTVSASTSTALLVSSDAGNQVQVWSLQPKFALRQVLDLGHSPSLFVLSPRSEIILSGYDDGRVSLHAIRNQGADIEAFVGGDEQHEATVCAGDFLDEKALVLTTSVDAIVHIWSQERVLLRQVTVATAVSSLCFCNADGDVLAGISTGSVFISNRDVLPANLPKLKPSRPQGWDSKQVSIVETGNVPHEVIASVPTTVDSEVSMLQGRPWEEPRAVNAALPERQQLIVSCQAFDFETSAKQLLEHVIQRPIEAATLRPPVLRRLERNLSSRFNRFSSSRNAECQSTHRNDTREDWRDELSPLSPIQKLMRASKQVIIIRRRQVSTLPVVLEQVEPDAQPSLAARRVPSGSQGEEIRPALPSLGLDGGAVQDPLLYCKHQAPVPPKTKTPRKLWNAVGGHDRRLLVLQRHRDRLPPALRPPALNK